MSVNIAVIVTAALLTVPATASPRSRFDLVCRGVTTTMTRGVAPIVKPSQARMSIDLAARRWCWRKGAECMQVFAIVAVNGNRLLLRDGRTAQGESRIVLDLATGAYASRIHIVTALVPPIDTNESGRCARAPSTRIP